MQIGVVFPQTEIGPDPAAVRRYAQRVEELGYRHLLAYDHVLGADPEVHPGWDGPYDVTTTFHEPFVLFGYLAAVSTLELVTGIIILPQRQTALVAKQAAEVDLLAEGRFRLGVGLGWNRVEYDALGQDFSTRGRAGPAAGAAANPGLVRRPVRAGVPADRAAGRRLVSAGRAGTGPRPGPGRGGYRRGRGGP